MAFSIAIRCPFFTMQKYIHKTKENPEKENIFPDFPVFFR